MSCAVARATSNGVVCDLDLGVPYVGSTYGGDACSG